jgi:hypothetical protein
VEAEEGEDWAAPSFEAGAAAAAMETETETEVEVEKVEDTEWTDWVSGSRARRGRSSSK